MAQFIAFDSNVEVNGETVLSVVDGLGSFKSTAERILDENGIADPKPGHWYKQQAWLNSFKAISEKIGDKTLFNIGKRIPENAQWPPQVNSIETALGSIDIAYHMNHRGGEIGNYKFEKISEKSVRLICKNPYPCSFDLGLIESAAKKFAQPNENVQVTHIEPEKCRTKNGDTCIYEVTW